MKAMILAVLLFIPAVDGVPNKLSFEGYSYAIDMNGNFIGDWEKIERCAHAARFNYHDNRPWYKRLLGEDFEGERNAQFLNENISDCQFVLSARHAGWIAAGGKAEDDPFQPTHLAYPDK